MLILLTHLFRLYAQRNESVKESAGQVVWKKIALNF